MAASALAGRRAHGSGRFAGERLVQGAALAGAALAAMSSGRGPERAKARRFARRGAQGAAAVLVQGGSHLLFDGLAVALRSAAGPDPDAPGPDAATSAVRLLALGSAALVLSAARHDAAEDRSGSAERTVDPGQAAPGRRALAACGYAACALSLPYPVVKLAWECGSDIGITRPEVIHAIPGGWLPVVPALAGSALSLALVRPWGRVVPTWVPGAGGSRVPRWMVLWPACFGVAVLAQVAPAALTAGIRYQLDPGKPSIEEIGLRAWVPLTFYACWLLWGGTLAGAAWEYHRTTTDAG
ncbi:hypothetical protein ACIGXA_10050 [Streptomyces fildesensis]|uniref:Integral membrane protein n=1 Tax=Streptomyces fildesensis TaxID=375757 RepID=A0ABW8C379_9ACTN